MKRLRAFVVAAVPLLALMAPGAPEVQAEPGACESWVVEYSLVPGSQLKIEDTPFGAGNGTFALGPGTLELRFRDADGAPAMKGKVTVVSYKMAAHVPITTNVLGLKTSVVSDTHTSVSADHCGKVASGLFKDNHLLWTTPFRAYRTDGTITCHGAMCGRFGAPPEGTSEYHIPPKPMRMMTLDFKNGDPKSFTSSFSLMEKTTSPASTSYIRLVGHEVGRTCQKVPACK